MISLIAPVIKDDKCDNISKFAWWEIVILYFSSLLISNCVNIKLINLKQINKSS